MLRQFFSVPPVAAIYTATAFGGMAVAAIAEKNQLKSNLPYAGTENACLAGRCFPVKAMNGYLQAMSKH